MSAIWTKRCGDRHERGRDRAPDAPLRRRLPSPIEWCGRLPPWRSAPRPDSCRSRPSKRFDDEGNSAIGVVAVVRTTKTWPNRSAARKAMRPDGDRARTSIADQIGALSDNDLVNEFGPRIWWDENGYPTIVAFGQWAWSPEGLDKRKKARRRDFCAEAGNERCQVSSGDVHQREHTVYRGGDQAKRPRNSASSIGIRHGER